MGSHTATPKLLAREARRIARTAYENDFESHWGFEACAPYVKMYDNHPFRDATLRGRLHAELIRRAAELGFAVAAKESYPASGESSGYTVAIIFDASGFDDHLDEAEAETSLQAIWSEVWRSVTDCKWTPTGRALRSV